MKKVSLLIATSLMAILASCSSQQQDAKLNETRAETPLAAHGVCKFSKHTVKYEVDEAGGIGILVITNNEDSSDVVTLKGSLKVTRRSSFNVTFDDGSKFELDGSDDVHGTYWGSISLANPLSELSGSSLCSFNK